MAVGSSAVTSVDQALEILTENNPLIAGTSVDDVDFGVEANPATGAKTVFIGVQTTDEPWDLEVICVHDDGLDVKLVGLWVFDSTDTDVTWRLNSYRPRMENWAGDDREIFYPPDLYGFLSDLERVDRHAIQIDEFNEEPLILSVTGIFETSAQPLLERCIAGVKGRGTSSPHLMRAWVAWTSPIEDNAGARRASTEAFPTNSLLRTFHLHVDSPCATPSIPPPHHPGGKRERHDHENQ